MLRGLSTSRKTTGPARTDDALELWAINAYVNIALTLRQVGDLVRPVDHLGRHNLCLLVACYVKNSLDTHCAGPLQWIADREICAHDRPASLRSPPARSIDRSKAAATKLRNSGAGRSGRDLNSG